MLSELLEDAFGKKVTETDILVLDSNEFVFGLSDPSSKSAELLKRIKDYAVAIPPIVVEEVTNNLAAIYPSLPRMFFGLLNDPSAHIARLYYDPPVDLWRRYLELGLAEEDAAIAAFAEWVGARLLISENRHFLRELDTDAFAVADAAGAMQMMAEGKIEPFGAGRS